MKEWNELPERVLYEMEQLGNFSPTVNVQYQEIKGYLDGGKTYYDSKDLRNMAKAFIVVAEWLEERALLENGRV